MDDRNPFLDIASMTDKEREEAALAAHKNLVNTSAHAITGKHLKASMDEWISQYSTEPDSLNEFVQFVEIELERLLTKR